MPLTAPVTMPARSYAIGQILLHWSIAVLVIWQLVFGESMGDVERVARGGSDADAATRLLATSHIWVGFAILALVVLRVALRLRHGTPPLDEPSRLARIVARGAGPAEAARFGSAVAGISVTRAGTAPSMPRLAEVEALLAAALRSRSRDGRRR